jgi:hypothetical protein
MGRALAAVAEARPKDEESEAASEAISGGSPAKTRQHHGRPEVKTLLASLLQLDQIICGERISDTAAHGVSVADLAEANSRRQFEGTVEQLKIVIQSADNLSRVNLGTSAWLRQVAARLREQGVGSFAKYLEGQADHISEVCLLHTVAVRRAYDATERLRACVLDLTTNSFGRDAPLSAGAMKVSAKIPTASHSSDDEKSLRSISAALESSAT